MAKTKTHESRAARVFPYSLPYILLLAYTTALSGKYHRCATPERNEHFLCGDRISRESSHQPSRVQGRHGHVKELVSVKPVERYRVVSHPSSPRTGYVLGYFVCGKKKNKKMNKSYIYTVYIQRTPLLVVRANIQIRCKAESLSSAISVKIKIKRTKASTDICRAYGASLVVSH